MSCSPKQPLYDRHEMIIEPALISVREAAIKLGRHKNTIYRMIEVGKLRKRSNGSGDRSFGVVAEDVEAIINPPQPMMKTRSSFRQRSC